MKKIIAALVLSTAIVAPACAADLVVKAPQSKAFPYASTGCYFGIAIKGGVDQVNASGNALFATSLASGSLTAAGGGVGGDVGCIHYYGPGSSIQWIGYEATAYYQNITAAAPAVNGAGVAVALPASYASRWSADATVKFGGFNPLSWLPNLGITFPGLPAPPTLPGISVLSPGLMYFAAGVEAFGVEGQFFTAGGSTVGIAPLVGAGIFNQILDAKGVPTGYVLDTGAQIVFADKALGVSNAFGTAGGPTIGSLSVGRKYEVYAKINF
jgi:hypothetical protein